MNWIVDARNAELSLPSVLGLGVQKGGTTTLHHFLAEHPQLAVPAQKEIHFFTLHYWRGPQWYASHYAHSGPGRLGVDVTPYYIFHPQAPGRIHSLIPQANLLLLLRDPVERTLSQVFHAQRLGFEPLPLEQALAAEPRRLRGAEAALRPPDGRHHSHQEHSYVARSRYAEQVRRYERLFPPSQLLVLRSEDLFARPEEAWRLILDFLGVDPIPLPARVLSLRANPGADEAAAVDPRVRERLREQLGDTYRWLEDRYGLHW
jgi:hypothetical protein